MAFDAFGRWLASHKVWDHVGNIIPDVECSEGDRPWGEFKPAAWLPVSFYDKFYEDYIVITPGKLVAFDNQNRMCPAQYGLSAATVTYTTTDTTRGTIDVRTGLPLVSGNEGTFNVSAVTSFMGTGVAMAVSRPVGVAPYAYKQWAGDGSALDDGYNPYAYKNHNYNMQHQVAVVCDYVLELPLMPATVAAAEALTEDTLVGNISTLNALSNLPVATNTVRTPFTFAEGVGAPGDVATRFAVQKAAASDVTQLGDWHVDYVTGVITVYDTTHVGATDYTLVYSHYASAPSGSNVSKYACALGDLKAGDFLVCNADSNWVVATPKTYGTADGNNFHTFADIMGQVLEVAVVKGRGYLDKVRTAYQPPIGTDATGSYPAYTGQMDQMAGSATGGVPSKVHYAGAADKVVRINLVSR